jgi:hypothetical protein
MVQRLSGVAIVVASIATLSVHAYAQEPPMKIAPLANMTRLGTIDERYQSYNIEMLEITGGMFWKPYGSASSGQGSGAPDGSSVPTGMDAKLYEYRPPVDLSNGKLRRLSPGMGRSASERDGSALDQRGWKGAGTDKRPGRRIFSDGRDSEWHRALYFVRTNDQSFAGEFSAPADFSSTRYGGSVAR